MKKHTLPALLLGLALLSTPVFAVYRDLPPDSPYIQAAADCTQAGIMGDVGNGSFAPERSVTLAEAMTVAARVHALTATGSPTLPAAAAEWGNGALTTMNGVKLLSFSSQGISNTWDYRFSPTSTRLHLYLTVTEAELSALTPAGGEGAAAKLTLNGVSVLSGTLSPLPQGHGGLTGPCMEFTTPTGSDLSAFHREMALLEQTVPQGVWYRDALWYAAKHGILKPQPDPSVLEAPAAREAVLDWLRDARPEAELPLPKEESAQDPMSRGELALILAQYVLSP